MLRARQAWIAACALGAALASPLRAAEVAAGAPGSVLVDVNVPASCRVGEERVLARPGQVTALEAAPGVARVFCSSEGHEDASAEVEVLSGKVVRVKLELRKRGAARTRSHARRSPAPPAASGPPTTQEILQVLKGQKSALRGCIEEALRKEPALSVGTIRVRLVVRPAGSVLVQGIDKPAVDGSPLGACLKETLAGVAFRPFDAEEFEVDLPLQITREP